MQYGFIPYVIARRNDDNLLAIYVCHPERSEGFIRRQILRYAQNDKFVIELTMTY